MAITIQCPCGKRLSTPDENAGKRARCPACGTVLAIPEPEAEPDTYDFEGEVPPEYASEDAQPSYRFDPRGPDPEPEPESFESSRYQGAGPSRFDPEGDDLGSSPREYLYLVLAVAFLPLAFSLLRDKDDMVERLERTFRVKGPALEQRLRAAPKAQLLAGLPGGRIEGALLAHDSQLHWAFAGLSAFGFLGLLALMFPGERASPWPLVLAGLWTATVGILFLLLVQWAADSAPGFHVRGKAAIFWLILLFIGFSYRAALDPSHGFLVSLLGFTFGVGLCEELCKALPLLWASSRSGPLSWRRSCLWGLASGIGFGVSEGVMYAGDHYNGLHGPGIYLVRFVSCVALHAVWGASVGIALGRRWGEIEGLDDLLPRAWVMLKVVFVPMLLHGLYDTTLKKDMNAYALLTALASFAWFTWLVESSRGREALAYDG